MALSFTPFMGMEYNANGDMNFRASYNNAMDTFDSIAVTNFALDGNRTSGTSPSTRLQFPPSREYVLDDSIFTPTANFEIIPAVNKFLHLGEKVYFEVQLKTKIAITVNADGGIINITLGTFSAQYPRRFGEHVMAINTCAAAYAYSTGNTLLLAAFGGQSASKTLPIGITLAIGGSYTI